MNDNCKPESSVTGFMNRPKARTFLIIGLSLILSACQKSQLDESGDWAKYGRTDSEQRFSPIDQINEKTVPNLGVAWYHEFDTDRGQESTPIAIGNVLYTSTAWSKVFAFDAASGKLLWSFDPEIPRETLVKACCDAVNRGVAFSAGRIFVGTLDGRLIALDSTTGKPVWSVQTTDPGKAYTITGAPHVVKNMVLIGNAGAEYGVRGYVTAYEINSGKQIWRFYTVPNPEEKADGEPSDKPLASIARKTWFGDGWKKFGGGGGTVWDSMAYDPEANLLYIGVGNGGPYDIGVRSDGKGDNLFLSSILALRADTGEYVWHYQTTPGDSWDYTATQQMILADMKIGGKMRKIIMQAPKNGFFYVLDRITGELLSAKPYVPVNWATRVDPASGRPQEVADAHYLKAPRMQIPGTLGGHSWHPMAYSPDTGLVYIPAQTIMDFMSRDTHFQYLPGHTNVGLDTKAVAFPDDPAQVEKIKSATFGELVAWDPVAKKRRWTVKHPFFLNGGVLATKGNLVFQGTAEGKLFAYDAKSGKELWSYTTINGIVAPPISYAINGRQYIAVMVGYGGFGAMLGTIVPDRPRLPGRLIVFALGAKTTVPGYHIPGEAPVNLGNASSKGDIVEGASAYAYHCFVCHGISANSRFTKDLRRSPLILSPDSFKAVVIGGAIQDQGMVSFAKWMSPQTAENIRAYLLSEARKLPQATQEKHSPKVGSE